MLCGVKEEMEEKLYTKEIKKLACILNNILAAFQKYYSYLSNALPYPWTVMIKTLHTIITNGAVRTTRGTI